MQPHILRSACTDINAYHPATAKLCTKHVKRTRAFAARRTTTRQESSRALSKTRHMAPFTMIGSSPRESAALLLGLVATMASLLPLAGSRAHYDTPREVPDGVMSCWQLLHLHSAGWRCWGALGPVSATTRGLRSSRSCCTHRRCPFKQGILRNQPAVPMPVITDVVDQTQQLWTTEIHDTQM